MCGCALIKFIEILRVRVLGGQGDRAPQRVMNKTVCVPLRLPLGVEAA